MNRVELLCYSVQCDARSNNEATVSATRVPGSENHPIV